jgi:hypothetical protein
MLSEFDGMGFPIHPNNGSRIRRRVLKTLQNIPGKGECQFLLFGDAVRPHEDRGFVAVFPER